MTVTFIDRDSKIREGRVDYIPSNIWQGNEYGDYWTAGNAILRQEDEGVTWVHGWDVKWSPEGRAFLAQAAL